VQLLLGLPKQVNMRRKEFLQENLHPKKNDAERASKEFLRVHLNPEILFDF